MEAPLFYRLLPSLVSIVVTMFGTNVVSRHSATQVKEIITDSNTRAHVLRIIAGWNLRQAALTNVLLFIPSWISLFGTSEYSLIGLFAGQIVLIVGFLGPILMAEISSLAEQLVPNTQTGPCGKLLAKIGDTCAGAYARTFLTIQWFFLLGTLITDQSFQAWASRYYPMILCR